MQNPDGKVQILATMASMALNHGFRCNARHARTNSHTQKTVFYTEILIVI